MDTKPNFVAIKQKQQATWASGDYSKVGTLIQIVGERICEAVDLRAGELVLDVAAGNGNASLAAARRFAKVTSTDYVPELLERGRKRAEADGLNIEFAHADAEALPFREASFDVVLSTFGAMFAPHQEATAKEMVRVLRKGGRIGLASWTPGGFIGQLFKLIANYAPPPAGLSSPALWGTEGRLRELFPGCDIASEARMFTFRFHSADHWIDMFREWYGPTNRLFAALDEDGKRALYADIHQLLTGLNRGGDTLVVDSEYLETVIRVK
ncbi:MAG: class I SAM-dependent methyltransferase [Rhizobiaceae bacterium]|nr:class I SAM-dependent methyltransferase [Rhizobiaceae bacterium]